MTLANRRSRKKTGANNLTDLPVEFKMSVADDTKVVNVEVDVGAKWT